MRGGVYRGVYTGAWSSAGGMTSRVCTAVMRSGGRYDQGGHHRCGCKWCERWSTRQTSRAAGVATRPAGSSVLCGDALDGDAEPAGLVDEVVGDAAARECDDALGQ